MQHLGAQWATTLPENINPGWMLKLRADDISHRIWIMNHYASAIKQVVPNPCRYIWMGQVSIARHSHRSQHMNMFSSNTCLYTYICLFIYLFVYLFMNHMFARALHHSSHHIHIYWITTFWNPAIEAATGLTLRRCLSCWGGCPLAPNCAFSQAWDSWNKSRQETKVTWLIISWCDHPCSPATCRNFFVVYVLAAS